MYTELLHEPHPIKKGDNYFLKNKKDKKKISFNNKLLK